MKTFIILSVVLFLFNRGTAQWTKLDPLPQSHLLSSVFFIDGNTGYVVGDSGTILKTTDAGTTWTALSSGTTKNLYSVQFTAANTGYVSGDTIFKTIDSGTTWSALSAGGRSISFPDAYTGYSDGPGLGIFKTINAGSTWTYTYIGGNGEFTSVHFINANIGYMTGRYAWQGSISRSVDGGSTWGFTYNVPPLFAIFFTDPNTGYAVGGDDGWFVNSSAIYKTNDGGSTWIKSYDTVLHTLRSVYFWDANTGYAVGDSGIILKTSNGGTGWTIQNSGTFHNLTSVFFTDANTGYVVGDSGTILKTTNGGHPLGINDQPFTSNSIKVYPNPASDNITIESSGNKAPGELSILSMNGQELISRHITGSVTKLDISGLPQGCYMVKMVGLQEVQVGKFIKN